MQDHGTRSKPHQELRPDLYGYLRDDIEIAASILARVDFEWASNTFRSKGSIDDSLPEWNMNLAELGHALHAVEDFFAHSNFIEHAALIMGNEFVPKEFLSKKLPKEVLDALERDKHLFFRRLKRYPAASFDNTSLFKRFIRDKEFPDWRKYDNEDYIVTGYFDSLDTLISIAHLSEEFFGIDAEDPARQAEEAIDELKDIEENPEELVSKAQKSLRDTLEFLEDPEKAISDEKTM